MLFLLIYCILFLSFGRGEEKVNGKGKTRAKVVSIEPGRARTRVASDHGQTMDQGRTHRGDSGGQEVRIPRSEIEKIVGTLNGRLVVLYGRVSGHGQKGDLDTQVERLQSWAATERTGAEILVLSDIGSGLKAGRRHLQRLLKLICEDKVAEVVITYEDRLTRFGQEYLETLFACFGVTLTVLDPGEEKTPEQELTDDLLALIASFSGRLYGMRSHKQKELLQCAHAVLTSP